jgi:tetratricopeptide (TPR) repeat protein
VAAAAMQLAERLNDPGVMTEALFMSASTFFYRGDFAGARDCAVRALADYDDRARTRIWAGHTGQDSGVTHRCFLALSLWHLGFPEQAVQMTGTMHDLAGALGHPFSLAYGHAASSWLAIDLRLGGEAVTASDEVIRIATEHGFPFWHAMGTLTKAGGLLIQERLQDALAMCLKGLDAYRATGSRLALTFYLGVLGEAYTQAGRFPEAHQALEDAFGIVEKNDERFHEAELHRLLGELHLANTGDQAAAEARFCTAIAIARAQQSKAWELRATTSLARLWQRQGRRDEAREALAAVYGGYTEGFATPDLMDAAALLETLAEPSALSIGG